MGYAGNMEPSYLIPTAIADSLNKVNILNNKMFIRIKHKAVLHKNLRTLN